MSGNSGPEVSFWCFACSRLHRPTAQRGEPVPGCTRCGALSVALEGVVDVVDIGAFVEACHPDAGLRAAAPLPTVTVRDSGRDCAVCMDELQPGAAAAVTPCDHAYHPSCIAPWLNARGTCPLCRAPVGGTDRDGLVTCRFPNGQTGIGRRVSGRIYGAKILDEDGEIVRPRGTSRFKGVCLRARMAIGALVRRDLAMASDV